MEKILQIKKSSEMAKINLMLINKLSGYKKNYAKEKIYLEKKFMELSHHGYKVSIARCFTFVGKIYTKKFSFFNWKFN